MNIYLVSALSTVDYDEYDAVVVIANDAEDARLMVTQGFANITYSGLSGRMVDVKLIGTALNGSERGEVLSSFNAG